MSASPVPGLDGWLGCAMAGCSLTCPMSKSPMTGWPNSTARSCLARPWMTSPQPRTGPGSADASSQATTLARSGMAGACHRGGRVSAGAAASGLSDGIQSWGLLRCHEPAGLEAVPGHLFSARPFTGVHAAAGAERLEDCRHSHQRDGTGAGAGHTAITPGQSDAVHFTPRYWDDGGHPCGGAHRPALGAQPLAQHPRTGVGADVCARRRFGRYGPRYGHRPDVYGHDWQGISGNLRVTGYQGNRSLAGQWRAAAACLLLWDTAILSA